MWNVWGKSRPSSHSGLFGDSRAPEALLSWGSLVLRAPALLQGKGVCAGRQPPMSSQLLTQLCSCLTFGWICSWGFWALSPAPFSLGLECSTVCVCVCVCVREREREREIGKCLSVCGWVKRLVLHDCNWEWIYESEGIVSVSPLTCAL